MSIFHGRLSRKNFGLAVVVTIGIPVILILVALSVLLSSYIELSFFLFFAVLIAFCLSWFILLISVYARRLHDIGRSGWLALLIAIPYVAPFLFVYLLIKKGSPEVNRYGEPNVGKPFWKSLLGLN